MRNLNSCFTADFKIIIYRNVLILFNIYLHIFYLVLSQQPSQFLKAAVKTEPADQYQQNQLFNNLSLAQQAADIKPILPAGFSVVQASTGGGVAGGVPVMNQLGLPPGQAQALQQVIQYTFIIHKQF
jgi:hypothetical protein